jgi:hypothetical protein
MSTPVVPPPRTPPYLEQYKAYLGDLGNIGTRYTTSNGFYLSVVTALLGILAYTTTNGAFASSQSYLAVTVPAFAMLVCWIWWRTIAYYHNLFTAKFKVLCEIENQGQLFPVYTSEYKFIADGRPPRSLLANDRLVPLLLALLFLAVLLYMVLCKPPR